jgi:hypothetical protein
MRSAPSFRADLTFARVMQTDCASYPCWVGSIGLEERSVCNAPASGSVAVRIPLAFRLFYCLITLLLLTSISRPRFSPAAIRPACRQNPFTAPRTSSNSFASPPPSPATSPIEQRFARFHLHDLTALGGGGGGGGVGEGVGGGGGGNLTYSRHSFFIRPAAKRNCGRVETPPQSASRSSTSQANTHRF